MENIQTSSTSAGHAPLKSPGQAQARIEEVSAWIDANAPDPSKISETLRFLAETTLPANPVIFEEKTVVNPFSNSLDLQLWHWNRAAGHLADKGAFELAAQVNAGMYLAVIALQFQYKIRLHKGMPLCNIGYYLARHGGSEFPRIAWLLGVAEDALTGFDGVRHNKNYRNLSTTRLAPSSIEQYISTIRTRFVELAITPTMPEIVLDFWESSLRVAPSKHSMVAMDGLINTAVANYPSLPEKPLDILLDRWKFLQFVNQETR